MTCFTRGNTVSRNVRLNTFDALTVVYDARTPANSALYVSHFVANDTRQFTYSEAYFARHLAVFAIFAFDVAFSTADLAGCGPGVGLDYAFTETLRTTDTPGTVAVVARNVAVAAAVITIDGAFAFTLSAYDATGSVAI